MFFLLNALIYESISISHQDISPMIHLMKNGFWPYRRDILNFSGYVSYYQIH